MAKEFKAKNPAEQFITQAQPTPEVGRPKSDTETKSKRTNILFYPSVYKDLQKIATMKQTSVNDLINQIADDYIQAEQDTIDKYNRVFKD